MPTPEIFTNVINSYLPEPQASLLNGMIFGVNLKTSKVFYDQLKAVGLLHIVVLSGMNITLLASIISIVTSFFGKLISSLLTILTIILFIFFVGFQAPIVRAGFMGILTLVAFLTGRRKQVIYILLLSLFFIFLFWPEWFSTLSLQLSYGATIGILFFGKTKDSSSSNFFKNLSTDLCNELRVSLAAQLFTAPLIFFHFKQISLIAPISNVLVAPLVAPIMIFGFATALLGKISHPLGIIPAYISYGILSYVVFVIETLAKFPFVFFKF